MDRDTKEGFKIAFEGAEALENKVEAQGRMLMNSIRTQGVVVDVLNEKITFLADQLGFKNNEGENDG
jgi:hypothetical protein